MQEWINKMCGQFVKGRRSYFKQPMFEISVEQADTNGDAIIKSFFGPDEIT